MFTFGLASEEAKFWLHDLTVCAMNAGFPAHELGDIVRHSDRSNRESLLACLA